MVERNRLGEILVLKGLISSNDLHFALKQQRTSQLPLGEVFLKHAMISRRELATILVRQYSLRMIAALMFYLAAITAINTKRAHGLHGRGPSDRARDLGHRPFRRSAWETALDHVRRWAARRAEAPYGGWRMERSGGTVRLPGGADGAHDRALLRLIGRRGH